MAYNVSNEYKQVIYSGDSRHKIKILFNNVELQEADRYCERATIKSRIIPNGAKRFSLNNFISKEVEIILHDIDTSIIQDKVSISIGTLVGNAYEYVPIGIFNIQGTPTTDKNKITIKLRDNSVKFDFNYNAKPLIDEKGGSATKLQILQDICSKANVTCNIISFIGSTDSIGIYDNTITARQYIADIAEQAGKIATINRNGELIFVNLNSLTTWNIPLSIVEKYEIGKAYRIGKVVYEDAIRKYETASTNYDTLYLDASNPYISSQEQVNSILQQVNNFTIDSVKTGKILGNPAIDSYDLINVYDDKVEGNPSIFKTLATSDLIYNGSLINTFDTQIGEEERKENVSIVGEATFKKWATANINNINGEIDIQAGKIDNVEKEINPTKDATGTSFYLEDSTNAELVNFEIEGKTTQASEPSPSNPSELVSVGYKNYFEAEYLQTTANTNINANLYKDTYTLSLETKENFGGVIYIQLYKNNTLITTNGHLLNTSSAVSFSTSSYWYYFPNIPNGNKLTFTLDDDYSLKIALSNATGSQKAFLVKGTQEHSYIPYGKYGIEVKTTGKNYFDNNKVKLNTTWNNTAQNGRAILFIETKPNTTYTISANNWNNLFYDIEFLDHIGSTTSLYSSGWNNPSTTLSKTFTTTSGTNILGLHFKYQNAGTTTMTREMFTNATIMLEKNTQATTFEEYKGKTYLYTLNQPLRSIGDTKDLLYIKNGMLYVERKIGSRILNGSESWGTIGDNRYWVAFPDKRGLTSAVPCMLKSNYFKPTNNAGDTVNVGYFTEGYYTIANYNVFFNYNGVNTDLAGFKTWLSTHNTEVQYVLASSNTEGLGKIEVPSTYKTTTYIDTTDANEPNMNITYVRDTQISNYVEEHISQIIVNEEGITQRVQKIEDSDYDEKINAIETQQTSTDFRINAISKNVTFTEFDDDGNPTNSNINSVTTTTGFTFNENGLNIKKSDTDYNTLIDNTGTYYKDGETIISLTNKDGFLAKDFRLQGQHYYSYNGSTPSNPLASENYDFVDERIEVEVDGQKQYAYATFYNGEV